MGQSVEGDRGMKQIKKGVRDQDMKGILSC
jgi:hypothetical protein